MKKPCKHEWIPCLGKICTSDLHTHHCSKCGNRAFINANQIQTPTQHTDGHTPAIERLLAETVKDFKEIRLLGGELAEGIMKDGTLWVVGIAFTSLLVSFIAMVITMIWKVILTQ